MLARNSRGLLVSLLSPAPTASEIENRPQLRDHGDRSQDAGMEEEARIAHEGRIEKEVSIKEEARIEHEERIEMEASLKEELARIEYEERIEKEVSIKEEERTKDEKKIQNPSDVALESAEYDEKLRLRGVIDLRYYYNMTRDANSLSTGRNTNSTEPGPAIQALTEDIMRECFRPYSEDTRATRSTSMEVLGGRFQQQSYPVQQQSANYSYGNQRSPSIELVRAAPIPSSNHKKERRLRTPSPSSPSEYPCLHPNCGHISSRAHDLKRHLTIHFPLAADELLDCKYEWCGRVGAHGFKRADHRKKHYMRVHMKENEKQD